MTGAGAPSEYLLYRMRRSCLNDNSIMNRSKYYTDRSGFTSSVLATVFLCGWLGLFLRFAGGAMAAENPGEWSRFRGPAGAGISSGATLPITWTDRDYRWKAALPGKGYSSPVVWGEKIFITSGDDATAKRHVVCVSAADGRVVWQRDYESKTYKQNRDNSYGTSTPTADDQRVYVYWTTPDEAILMALDHSGKEIWKRTLGPFASQHGSGTSPVVYGDLVVVGNDQDGGSFLLAVDAKTGETRWQTERRADRAAYSTPGVLAREGGMEELIFTSTSHGVTGLNPRTGKVNWELTNAFPLRVVGSPVVAAGLIVGTCGEGGTGKRLVAVRPGSATQPPQLVYEMKTFIPYVPTPLAKDGLLFLWGDNGLVACLRAATGERVWQEKVPDSFFGSPVWVDGRLYCISKTGVVYVVAATEKYALLANVPLGEPSFSTPAVANGVMYLRTASQLFALGGTK